MSWYTKNNIVWEGDQVEVAWNDTAYAWDDTNSTWDGNRLGANWYDPADTSWEAANPI